MSSARRVLLVGGLCLAALGMLYGLHYAVFVEHQTLDRMGASLAQAFTSASQRDTAAAHGAIDAYASTKYNYVRQVDVHSHWIGLGMLLIVLGAAFDDLALSGRMKTWLAAALVTGSFVFPMGVILQAVSHGAAYASSLAVFGSAIVTASLVAVAWGFARVERP
jgi:hypothetical protein